MRFKLDENLGRRGLTVLRQAGHDSTSVGEQGLSSATDNTLIAVCHSEDRCLVTLDLDFANPFHFPPLSHSGIAVLRLPSRATAVEIDAALETMIDGLRLRKIDGRLWIVQRGRIREFSDGEIGTD